MPVSRWDPTPYPDPRRNRGLPTGPGDEAVAAIRAPSTFNWSWELGHNVADGFRCLVSPKLVGPGIIKEIFYRARFSQSAARLTTLALLVSADGAGEGVGAALAPLPAGLAVFSGDFSTSRTYAPLDVNALYGDSNVETVTGAPIRLDYITNLPEFFVKLVLRASAAVQVDVLGTLLAYEDVDPELLPELLG